MSCKPYDVISSRKNDRVHIHKLLRTDLLCEEDEHAQQCDSDNLVVGPIKQKDDEDVFYIVNQGPLEIERFEFHKSKNSLVADSSYIYMLKTMKNYELSQLDEYLGKGNNQVTDEEVMEEMLLADFNVHTSRIKTTDAV